MFENIKKKLKLGYYNPNSPKYYKGYRYSKNEFGSDYWYDENGNLRKAIGYWGNGNKNYEEYYNENGKPHNEDGYAYQSWYTNGDINIQQYYLNDIQLTEDVFKKIINNKVFESTYPSSPNYYNGYIYVKTETNEEYWYDDKFNIKKRNIYYENGILKEERIYGEKMQIIRFNEKSEIEWKNDIAVAGHGEKNGYYLSGRKLSYFEWYLLRDLEEFIVIEETDKFILYKDVKNKLYIKFVFTDGVISNCLYFNENKELHNENGYAVYSFERYRNYINYNECKYFLFDKEISPENFKVNKIIEKNRM